MQFATLTRPLGINDIELLLRLFFAVVIGGVIGLEREYKNRPAGMRTHVLVCLGAASISLLESLLWATSISGGVSLSLGRLSAQVISGIGFLGAGTIFMAQKKISGLTTAASLWNVACIGILVGFGYYWIALILCFLVIFVLQLLGRIVHINAVKHVEVRFINRQGTLPFINAYFESVGIRVLDIDFHIESQRDSGDHDLSIYTNIYTLQLPSKLHYIDIVTHLSEYQDIQTVRTRNT
ncbi:MAG: MgtC/SapB family protein [Christensenellales bacterium]